MFHIGLAARRLFVWTIALVAAASSAGQSFGQSNWSNPAGGNWSVGGNWAEGVPPSGTTTSLVFGTAATRTSTYTATNELLGNPLSNLTNITINNTSGAVTLAGNQFSFTSPTSSITIASAGNLIINNSVVFAHAADALTVGGTGTGNVNISSITGSANSLIMNAASGSLTLSGGGTFTQMSLRGGNTFFTGGTRFLTNPTNGDNSSSGLQLGNASGQTASATISNGAAVNVTENVYIGDAAGSTGTLTVTGAGSVLNATGGASNRLGVGNNGSGTLNILNGGVVNAQRLLAAQFVGATSSILVDGADSTLHVTTQAAIASNGPGDVTIQNGGLFKIDAGALTMGVNAPGSGTLTVTGTGSTVNAVGGLSMGIAAGTGTFGVVVANGGTFTNGNSVFMAPMSGVTANISVTGSGSTLTTPEFLVVAGTGVGGAEGGTGNVSVGSGGSLSVVKGTSIFVGGTINLNTGGSFSTGNIADGNGTSFGAVNLAAGTTLNLTGALGTSDGTFSGVIDGAGGIVKTGTSLQTFAGSNTYSGGTTINAGSLIITNSAALGTGSIAVGAGATLNSSAVPLTVPTNATLSGAGTVTATDPLGLTVNPNATIRGGASGTTDTLTITGNLNAVAAGGSAERTQITVNGTTASLVQVSGIVNFLSDGNAPYVINIQNGGGLTYNMPYTRTVVSATGGFFINGAGPLPAGTTFVLGSNYAVTSDFASVTGLSLSVDGTGQNLILNFTPVPEPTTVIGIAAAGLFLFRMRRRIV